MRVVTDELCCKQLCTHSHDKGWLTCNQQTRFELHNNFTELQTILALRKTILVCDNAFADCLMHAGLRCNILVL